MAEKPVNVVIIGGSLTGLMHGIVLKRLGHNVRILERNSLSELHDQGAGVAARDGVQEMLAKYDLSREPYAIQSPYVQFLNKDATLKSKWNIALPMTSWNTLYFRLRANYDGLRSEYCPRRLEEKGQDSGKAIYSYRCTVTDVKHIDGSMTVEFDDVDGGGGSLHADLIIAADGPRSRIRQILEPGLKHEYAGYAAWRGTVPEVELSKKTRDIFGDKTTFFRGRGTHILLYIIPGQNGTLVPGSRLINYVWYRNYAADASSLADIMTDSSGHRHRNTLPLGGIQPSVRTQLIADAKSLLPFPFAELVAATPEPFVQIINGINSPRASFFDGKLILAGDALATFRPHWVSSTNQAALNALTLGKVMTGDMTMNEWERGCMQYAWKTAQISIALGCWNQGRFWEMFVAMVRLVMLLVFQAVENMCYRWLG